MSKGSRNEAFGFIDICGDKHETAMPKDLKDKKHFKPSSKYEFDFKDFDLF